MDFQVKERMDGLVDERDVAKVESGITNIVKEFREEGFDDMDIGEFIGDIVMGILTASVSG